MTDRAKADLSGYHLHVSRLLVVAVIGATASTGALVATLLTEMPEPARPPGPPGTMPPPPPDLGPLAVFTVVTGFFVLSWLAVLVVFSRDQILQHVRRHQLSPDRAELDTLLAGLRAELAADRERELNALTEQVAELTNEYGERRETDGYLKGMRSAADGPAEPNVRALRRTPPQR
jgi:hypothetical protein